MDPEKVKKYQFHEGEILQMRLINDTLFVFSSDNMLTKFDLVKEEKLQVFKSKFPLTSIRLIIPVEKDDDLAEVPDRSSAED